MSIETLQFIVTLISGMIIGIVLGRVLVTLSERPPIQFNIGTPRRTKRRTRLEDLAGVGDNEVLLIDEAPAKKRVTLSMIRDRVIGGEE